MTKYALRLEYDGSDFYGWQIQKDMPSVQQVLERALSKFAAEPISTITAGRTDTGVHALNQVVHFKSNAKRQLTGWINGVNRYLPTSICVKEVADVDESFDARFLALSRTYHYYLLIQPAASTHLARYTGWYYKELDVVAIDQALKLILGSHDFSSFRASACQAANPTRIMHHAQIEQQGRMLRFSFTANAFLHHMIRNLVGALVYVGNAKINLAEFKTLLEAKDRRLAPPTFMANGLYLVDVSYPTEIFQPHDNQTWLYN